MKERIILNVMASFIFVLISFNVIAQKPHVTLIDSKGTRLYFDKPDRGSINGRNNYNEESVTAIIKGQKGTAVIFYDDQKFRKGENYVKIIKTDNKEITVTIGENFKIKDLNDDPHRGEGKGYKYEFYRRVKKSWLLEKAEKHNVPGHEYFTPSKSNNFRVDNCSSIDIITAKRSR